MAEIDNVLREYVRERTPAEVPDFQDVTARARRRSRTRVATLVAGSLVVVIGSVGVAVAVRSGGPASTIVAIPSPTSVGPSPSPGRAGQRSGALPDNGASSCVEEYSPQTVAHRAFAFDGTVTHLGPGTTDRPGYGKLDRSGAGRPGYVAVTFTVNAWFHGGTSAKVTADMTSPATGSGGEAGPTYRIGSRLLVSGEPRWGGPALRDAIVWGCGFTRYYDAQTAAAWRQAMP